MKIVTVRAKVYRWRGDVVPPQPNFCTNPMDIISGGGDTMKSFRFHECGGS